MLEAVNLILANMHANRTGRLSAWVVVGLMAGFFLMYGVIVPRAERRMNALATIMSQGQLRLMLNEVGTVMTHGVEEYNRTQSINKDLCETSFADLRGSRGLLAVLAVGDKNGNAVCTADPDVAEPLPTMSDRSYYRDVQVSLGMVVGEFAISKTTGKPVLHFAYPLRDKEGQFQGLVMAGVDLTWFVSEEVGNELAKSGVSLVGVDQGGKILFKYPGSVHDLGQNALPAKLISLMLAGEKTPSLLRGYDGKYRIYAYQWVEQSGTRIAVVAGVTMNDYWQVLGLGVGLAGLVGWALGQAWGDRASKWYNK